MNSAIYSSSLFNISLAEIQKISQHDDYYFTSNFSDGFSDGENNFEPIVYQWFNSDYRQGYLIGLAKRIGIDYALIYNQEEDRVLVV